MGRGGAARFDLQSWAAVCRLLKLQWQHANVCPSQRKEGGLSLFFLQNVVRIPNEGTLSASNARLADRLQVRQLGMRRSLARPVKESSNTSRLRKLTNWQGVMCMAICHTKPKVSKQAGNRFGGSLSLRTSTWSRIGMMRSWRNSAKGPPMSVVMLLLRIAGCYLNSK